METIYVPATRRLERVQAYVSELLVRNLPASLVYHGPEHTLHPRLGVVSVSDMIARLERVRPEERELIVAAAYFHDTGFIKQRMKNEPIGARMAGEALPGMGYAPAEIETVHRLIMATQMPTSPHDHLEEIICDADVDNLGRDDFFEKGEMLRVEIGVQDIEKWYETQVKFLEAHKYYTKTSQLIRGLKKEENLEECRRRLGLFRMKKAS